MKFISQSVIVGVYASLVAADYLKTCTEVSPGDVSNHNKSYPKIDIEPLKKGSRYVFFKLEDLPNTNIPFFTYGEGYNLASNKDAFHICTEELVIAGECEKGDGFSVKVKKELKFQMVNIEHDDRLKGYSYEAYEPGVYCLVGYHESSGPSFKVITNQVHGNLEVEDFAYMKFMERYIIPLELIIFLALLFQVSKSKKEPFHPMIYLIVSLASATQGYHLPEMLRWELLNNTVKNDEGESTFVVYVLDIMATGMFLFIISLFYSLSRGSCGILHNRVVPSKLFVFLIMIKAFARAWTSGEKFGTEYQNFDQLMVFVDIFGYIPMWALLFKHSKTTQGSIMDPTIKGKYALSRKLTIFTPIFLYLASSFSTYVIAFVTTEKNNTYFDPTEEFERVYISTMENRVLYSNTWVFLASLSSFSLPIIIIGYFLIWVRQTSPRGLVDEVKAHESFDRSDLEKNNVVEQTLVEFYNEKN